MSSPLELALLNQLNNPFYARMYLASTYATPTSLAAIAFDTKAYDPAHMCTSGAGAKITIIVPGLYRITTAFKWANNSVNGNLFIYKNGSEIERGWNTPTQSFGGQSLNDSFILNAGDYIQSFVFTSGASTFEIDDAGGLPFLSVTLERFL